MKRSLFVFGFCGLMLINSFLGWSATNNTGNNPTFLIFDVVSNVYHEFSPDGVDVGVDVGNDGTFEYWISTDTAIVTRESSEPRNNVGPDNWKRIIVRLDEFAGQTAKIRIVDNSESGYIAVNSIRLNNADGTMTPNGVPNGFFEADPPLAGWNIISGNLTADQLIGVDTGLNATHYSTQYLTTQVNGLSDKATIDSDPFELTPISSFIYGVFGGPASSRWDKPEAYDSDNGIFVYVDLGTESQDPNGAYTSGEDIPLIGFMWHNHDAAMETVIINTSGFEGRRAQVVAADASYTHGISLDAIRMNWDNNAILNGGFESGIEGGFLPEELTGSTPPPEAHPSGSIPGWTVNTIPLLDGSDADDPDATFTFFGNPAGGFSRSERVWIGSGSLWDAGGDFPDLMGVELRSDVFTIEPIPDPSQSIFMSFSSAQNSTRIEDAINPVDGSGEDKKNSIELRVDVNDNGTFDDEEDFTYRQINQGISWNGIQKGGVDEWQFPDYRFYIDTTHQGKNGQIYIADLLTGGWAWMAADDFYFWDGHTADLAFPNSDFEMGNLTHWNEEINTPDNFSSWLVSTPENVDAGLATDWFMNRPQRSVWVDGEFGVDSADRNTSGGGDNMMGILRSEPFPIPTLSGTAIDNWSLLE